MEQTDLFLEKLKKHIKRSVSLSFVPEMASTTPNSGSLLGVRKWEKGTLIKISPTAYNGKEKYPVFYWLDAEVVKVSLDRSNESGPPPNEEIVLYKTPGK